MSNSRPAVRSSRFGEADKNYSGSKFRKRDPGSGGSRPGAGRRPDLPNSLRELLFRRCELLFAMATDRYWLGVWSEKLLDVWLDRATAVAKRRTWLRLVGKASPRNSEFLFQLIHYPETLFGDDGSISFAPWEYREALKLFAEQIGFSPNKSHALPVKLRNKVRRRAVTQVLSEAGSEIQVSEKFLLNAWKVWRNAP